MSREEVEAWRAGIERWIDARSEQYMKDAPGTVADEDEECTPSLMENYEEIYRDGLQDGVEHLIPTRYTPREEVTEGWWFAQIVRSPLSDREVVQCIGDSLLRIGDRSRWEIDDFTDFLPVPAWLVEGLK